MNVKCQICQSGGCLDIIIAHRSLEPFKCPTRKQYIYFTLPKGMIPATIADFYNHDGTTLRLNMPYLLYNLTSLYYAHHVTADLQPIDIERFTFAGIAYILSEHKQS